LIAGTADLKAQPGTVVISGTVAEKANLELSIYRNLTKGRELLAEYKVFAGSPDFAFTIPVDSGSSYGLGVGVMKQGHRRLEVDKRFEFPLSMKPGQNLSMKINPSLLDIANKGIEIKRNAWIPAISFVSGNLSNLNSGIGAISLQKAKDGELISVTSFNTTKTNKRFQLAVPVKEEGFYYVSSLRFRCRVYLKPADKLELNINAFTGEYDLISGSEENRWMEKWQKLALPITDYGYNRSVFQADTLNLERYISVYQNLQPAIKDLKSANKTSNARFNSLFVQSVDVDNEFAPLYLLSCLSIKGGHQFDRGAKMINRPPDFFRQFIQPGKFSDARILEIAEGMNYINAYHKLNIAFMPEADRKTLSRAGKMKIMMNTISNDTVKSFFLKQQLETAEINNLSEFRSIFQPYEKYSNPPMVKKKYEQVYQSFIGDTAYVGKSSYNFSLPDTSGHMVSMRDFKGKVVFIDVWATWCGPCRGEIPFLKQLEEEYKNNSDIVFLGISIDSKESRQKWIRFIQKEKLDGTQLLDDEGKTFGKKYGIAAVPRFLLIDRQGKWIEVRCPLPSNTMELKKYLDAALQEAVAGAN